MSLNEYCTSLKIPLIGTCNNCYALIKKMLLLLWNFLPTLVKIFFVKRLYWILIIYFQNKISSKCRNTWTI